MAQSDQVPEDGPKQKGGDRGKLSDIPLQVHRIVVFVLYLLAARAAYVVLSSREAQLNLVALLSTASIFATLGAAISGLGSMWERDLLERIILNVNIFMKEISKQETPWRRWPFIPRLQTYGLLDGNRHSIVLSNPSIPLDVGTHLIKIDLPTVLEDFFDLPLIRNVGPLIRFRRAAHTSYARWSKDTTNPDTGRTASDEYMAYECLLDIWASVLRFRVARYAVHFGSALTLSAVAVAARYLTTGRF